MEPVKFPELSAGFEQLTELELLNTNGGGIGGAFLTAGLALLSPGLAFFHMGMMAGLRATD